MQIYSSLSRKKETLSTLEPGTVRMYVCGMTVYDFCHLGHARMLVSFDVVTRWLHHCGYIVQYTRNITDVDDKIIRKAVETNRRMGEVTEFYIEAMHADERALNVRAPTHEPRATEHISGMLDIIEKLQAKGLAYTTAGGDVNFSVRGFPDYGKLSGRSLDDMRAGERVAVNEDKRDPLDFVLWKAAKEDEPEESKWPSSYGLGRPGWHIECSAMSKELGLPLDIHGGGPDLKFPHHENEIAQSEGAFGGQLANIWMHCGPLMVDAEKMSKSLGNFKTIRQLIGEEVDDEKPDYTANPREAEMLRFFIVRNHYRSPQNFTLENLNDAQAALDRLYQTLASVPYRKDAELDRELPLVQQFTEAMNDDFNTAEAVRVLFELANQANREKSSDLASQLCALGEILGLLQQDPEAYQHCATRYSHGRNVQAVIGISDEEVDMLVTARTEAKKARQFEKADQIREQLQAAGIVLEDKPDGTTKWRHQ